MNEAKDLRRTMKRPNILLITTDEQRYDTIGAMGYDFMKTPNLDKLALEGCCYTNAYSNNPVCMAARHNILTGLTARYHGFDTNYFENDPRVIPYNLPTLPQLLSDAEYDTIAIGKMHFQPCRRHNGFTKMELMEEIPRNLEDDEYAKYLSENGYGDIQSLHGVRHLLYMLPQRSMIAEKHHGTSWVAERSIHHLKENNGKRPFFMWSSFIAPHPPFDVPQRWANLYKGTEFPPLKISETPTSKQLQTQKNIADYPSEIYFQRARELYYASISFVDFCIGKIIQQLKEMGEYDNTVIVFTSDHGEMMGDYGTFQKGLPYDSAAKIPFIIRYPPQIKPGSREEKFVDLNDLLPTFLDAARVPYPNPEILPGESIFKKSGEKNRNIQYIEYGREGRRWISLRNRKYKYNYYYGGGREELFDMMSDPDETKNLLYGTLDPTLIAVKESMNNQLMELEKQYGLKGYVQEGQFLVFEEPRLAFRRESNPPIFSKKQNRGYVSLEEEVKRAIADEEVVKLQELDIDYFAAKGIISRETLLDS